MQVLIVKSKIDVMKFFNSKKRNLDNNSILKKMLKDTKESSELPLLQTPETHGAVFEEALKSEGCIKILLNCLKNFEKEV